MYGSGGVSWITSSKVKLRVRVEGISRSKTVTVSHRDHGGRGEAENALAAFIEEVATDAAAVVPATSQPVPTLGEALSSYIELSAGSTRPGTIESYGTRQESARPPEG